MTDFKALGLSSIQIKDSGPSRRAMWQSYCKKNILARMLADAFQYNRLKKILTLLRFFTSLINLSRFSVPDKKSRLWCVYHYENESRAFKAFLDRTALNATPLDSIFVCFNKISFKQLYHILFRMPFLVKQTFREVMQLENKSFLVTMRQVDFLIYYNYWAYFFKEYPELLPALVASSSEGNPEIIGLTLAAKAFCVPQLYINHGSLTSDLGIFFHDHYYLSNYDLKDKIKTHHGLSEQPRFFVAGNRTSEGTVSPVSAKENPNILIVGSILNNIEKTLRLLQKYKLHFPQSKIYFRPHPNQIISQPLTQEVLNTYQVEIVSTLLPVAKQAQGFDLILVGNSSAAQEIMENLTAVFCVDIDDFPYDAYGFIKHNFIPIGDSPKNLKTQHSAVFLASEWQNKLDYFCPARDNTEFEHFQKFLITLFQA